ncbi:MAG: response regulator [Methylococcales bacterium]
MDEQVKAKPTIFLVDDDADVRDALSLFLDSAGLHVIPFDSAIAFLSFYKPEMPGCLILDIDMPNMSGIELQDALVQKQIPIPIIFLTAHGTVPLTVKAFKSGATDFIEKPFNDQVLLQSIEKALEKDVGYREENEKRTAANNRIEQLTPREKEVMNRVVTGLSSKEIARELQISHRTVDIHRSRIMVKMQVKSLPELIALTTQIKSGLAR